MRLCFSISDAYQQLTMISAASFFFSDYLIPLSVRDGRIALRC
jgi:hypothetical protein